MRCWVHVNLADKVNDSNNDCCRHSRILCPSFQATLSNKSRRSSPVLSHDGCSESSRFRFCKACCLVESPGERSNVRVCTSLPASTKDVSPCFIITLASTKLHLSFLGLSRGVNTDNDREWALCHQDRRVGTLSSRPPTTIKAGCQRHRSQ